MLDITYFTSRYTVRRMTEADADMLLSFCMGNQQYYRYCTKQPTRERILNDLVITPPGIGLDAKYYVGFFDGTELIAILDLIEGYPDHSACFLGFFMMNAARQGRGEGSRIIDDLLLYLRAQGFAYVMLGIDKGNPQSTHFWKKNGFAVIREAEQDSGTILVAKRDLRVRQCLI